MPKQMNNDDLFTILEQCVEVFQEHDNEWLSVSDVLKLCKGLNDTNSSSSTLTKNEQADVLHAIMLGSPNFEVTSGCLFRLSGAGKNINASQQEEKENHKPEQKSKPLQRRISHNSLKPKEIPNIEIKESKTEDNNALLPGHLFAMQVFLINNNEWLTTQEILQLGQEEGIELNYKSPASCVHNQLSYSVYFTKMKNGTDRYKFCMTQRGKKKAESVVKIKKPEKRRRVVRRHAVNMESSITDNDEYEEPNAPPE
jgi:hypothetical protein